MEQELTPEQKTQEIIKFNQYVASISTQLHLMTEEERQIFAERVAERKAELGIE